MPNVFVDFHHASLLQSFILLFEKRLGGTVFRPIGMEWAERGFWKVYDHPATQAQYLAVGGATPDGTRPLNETEGRPPVAGVYWCNDIDSDSVNKAITFESFMRMPFDYVIATLPQHIQPFRKLVELHPNHPKLIYQIGNAWNIEQAEASLLDGVMSSALVPLGKNLNGYNGQPLTVIQYHQEFDLGIFYPHPPHYDTSEEPIYGNDANRIDACNWCLQKPKNVISSFVNCFNVDQMFQYDWEFFQKVEASMNSITPPWTFKVMGGQCRDGAAHGSRELADRMRESMFIWHTKVGGDGYGHVIHNAAACGKPIIFRASQYQGKMAERLLIDRVTGINIDNLTPEEIVNRIIEASQPDTYREMRMAMTKTFKENVNFDQDEQAIRAFLASIV